MPRAIPLLTALLLGSPALAQDSEPTDAPTAPTAEATHQREVRNAWIVFASGVGITSAGVATLLVGRGNSGEVSSEANTVAEARSMLGAAATIGGLTTILVGTVKLEQAWGGRSGKARTALALTPLRTVDHSSGLTLTLTR